MKLFALGGLLFMAFFTSLMANSKEPEMHQRVVQLPGVELRFSMTEDFSKDMPAAPLIENVTGNMLNGLKKSGDRFVIGRRWWDPKPPGWFKKPWGSMQMTVAIGAAVDKNGKQLDFCKFTQAEFLVFYRDALIEKWRPHNEGISPENQLQYGVEVPPFFGAIGQRFVPHFGYKKTSSNVPLLEVTTGYSGVIQYYFVVPVGGRGFLEFEFIGAPNANVSAYQFHDFIRGKIHLIKSSTMLISGKEHNCLPTVEGKWIEADSVELLKPDPSLLPKPVPADTIKKFIPESANP